VDSCLESPLACSIVRFPNRKLYFVLMRVKSFFVTFIPLICLHAQTLPLRPLIPRAILFGQPEHTYPQLSPNGLQIAYERNVAGVAEVWVRTLGTNDDCAVTSFTSQGFPSLDNS
jgi:hypothetical protein